MWPKRLGCGITREVKVFSRIFFAGDPTRAARPDQASKLILEGAMPCDVVRVRSSRSNRTRGLGSSLRSLTATHAKRPPLMTDTDVDIDLAGVANLLIQIQTCVLDRLKRRRC